MHSRLLKNDQQYIKWPRNTNDYKKWKSSKPKM